MHIGFTFTLARAAIAAAAATVAAAAARFAGLHPAPASIAVFIVVAAAAMLTWRGRTPGGWIIHRRRSPRRIPRLTQLISRTDTAILWDHTGRRASIVLEITPPPFGVSTYSDTHTFNTPTVNINALRADLRQYDITVHDLTWSTIGYTIHPGPAASVAFATTGPIAGLSYARTWCRVSIELTESMASIDARKIDNFSDPRHVLSSGLARTIEITADRIHRRISRQGFTATKLSRPQLADLHNALAAMTTAGSADEKFTHAGQGPYIVGFTPTTKPDRDTTSKWMHATTGVCAAITRIKPVDARTDAVEQFYLNRTDRLDTLAFTESIGLRKEFGQHTAIAEIALPAAVPPTITATTPTRVPRTATSDITATPAGAGIYLGQTLSGTGRIWLDITTASAEPLWIHGPAALAQLLVLRASTLGMTIVTSIAALSAITSQLNPSHPQPGAPALVITAHKRPQQPSSDADPAETGHRNTAVGDRSVVPVIWTPEPPEKGRRHRYVITEVAPGTLDIHTPATHIQCRWAASEPEKTLLTELLGGRR